MSCFSATSNDWWSGIRGSAGSGWPRVFPKNVGKFYGQQKSREIPRNGVETCETWFWIFYGSVLGAWPPQSAEEQDGGSPEGWGDWMQCRCSNALHAGCAWVPSQTSVSIRCCSPCLGRQYQLNRFFLFNELSRELTNTSTFLRFLFDATGVCLDVNLLHSERLRGLPSTMFTFQDYCLKQLTAWRFEDASFPIKKTWVNQVKHQPDEALEQ